MMDLGDLKRMALKYMTSHVSSSNCLAVWQVSELYSCNIAAAEARSYALKNFTKVIDTPDFLKLEPQKLMMLLSDDLLKVPEETVVLEALTKWFKHNENERREFMPELLNSVRCGTVTIYLYFLQYMNLLYALLHSSSLVHLIALSITD
jgi:hypothetical protein